MKIKQFFYASLICFAADSAVIAQNSGSTRDEPDSVMGFFVTSRGMGKGGDLGGLKGADTHCQKLAEEAGAGARRWRAYLSTSATDKEPAVNARDRIGLGPWSNYDGEFIARNASELDETGKTIWEISASPLKDVNNVNAEFALTERGQRVTPLTGAGGMHNILTGSRPDGTAYHVGRNLTCNNWTSNDAMGAVQVGHVDRAGNGPNAKSWNAAEIIEGCSQAKLTEGESGGLFYCFAEI